MFGRSPERRQWSRARDRYLPTPRYSTPALARGGREREREGERERKRRDRETPRSFADQNKTRRCCSFLSSSSSSPDADSRTLIRAVATAIAL